MEETIERILKVVAIIAILGIVAYLIYSGVKYEKECTYETETIVGIVSDKEKHRRFSSTKPVIYRTVYKTEVTLPNGTKTTFSGSAVYNACEVGDEILIEVERKYHNGELVRTDYKTVDSKQGN